MTKTAVLKVQGMHCELNAEQFREAIEDAGYALVGAEKG